MSHRNGGFDLVLSLAFLLFVLSAIVYEIYLSLFSSPFLHIDSSEYLANGMWLAGFDNIGCTAFSRNIGFSLLISLFVVFKLQLFVWLLPLFFKIYSLISVFVLSRIMFSKSRDLQILSTILLTFNWHYAWWGNSLLTTVPATSLSMIALACLYKWVSNREPKYLFLTILISVACFYIRYLQGIILCLFTILYVMVMKSEEPQKRAILLARVVIPLFLLLLPWCLFNWKYFEDPTYGVTMFYARGVTRRMQEPLDPVYYIRLIPFLVSAPCVFMAVVGFVNLARRWAGEEASRFLVAWSIFIYSVMSMTLAQLDRYATFFTPFLLILCSLGLKVVRRISSLLFIIILLLSCISTADYHIMPVVRISDFTIRERPIYLGIQRIVSLQGSNNLNQEFYHVSYHVARAKSLSTTMYVFHVNDGSQMHMRFLVNAALNSKISVAPSNATYSARFHRIYSNSQYVLYCENA